MCRRAITIPYYLTACGSEASACIPRAWDCLWSGCTCASVKPLSAGTSLDHNLLQCYWNWVKFLMGCVLFRVRSGVLDCCFGSAIRLSHLARNFYSLGLFFVSLYKSDSLLHFHVWTLVVGTIGGPCAPAFFLPSSCAFVSVFKAGRGRQELCLSYRDTSEGGALWGPLATKILQLQSNADFCASLVFLANL